MANDVTPVDTAKKAARERGKRIWLPGSKRLIASVEHTARRKGLRLGQYLMMLAIEARAAKGEAA